MMKKYSLIFILFLICSCHEYKSKEGVFQEILIPKIYTLKSSAAVNLKNDIVFLHDKKYSGFLYELALNTKDTISIEGYHQGLLQGISKKWYPNKQLLEARFYNQGEKHGKQISYWEDGKTRFEFTAENDLYEGELKEYNAEGKLFHLATYKNGQEEGTQKMWYDNGKTRANYVIINGKRYGLLGTKNCKNVSDSIFVVK